MQLEHSFTVPVPVDDAWRVLLDIEQIAPCMPGAVLDSMDGDNFTGRVKVKLGPISLTYKGKASFVKKDEATHTAVIDAAGKDQRGNGTAAATVTATLKSEGGSSTRVGVQTDLNITGKPAQFGRGVMVDVGNKLIGQFATCLEAKLSDSIETHAPTAPPPAAEISSPAPAAAAPSSVHEPVDGGKHVEESAPRAPAPSSAAPSSAAPSPPAPSRAAPRPQAVPAREPEPIDLLDVAGGSVLTRIGIPAAGLAVAVAIVAFIIRKIRN